MLSILRRQFSDTEISPNKESTIIEIEKAKLLLESHGVSQFHLME